MFAEQQVRPIHALDQHYLVSCSHSGTNPDHDRGTDLPDQRHAWAAKVRACGGAVGMTHTLEQLGVASR